MINRPKNINMGQLPKVRMQRYERYLPTAFDESLSILEKVNKVIQYLYEYSEMTDEMLGKWNEVYEWVMNDGLDEAVTERLQEMVDDGTFEEIINERIFGELNDKIDGLIADFDEVIEGIEADFEELKKQLIKDFEVLKNSLPVIYVQEKPPSNKVKNMLWYEVL